MQLVILHTNDTHGHLTPLPNATGQTLGGYARRATFVEQQRASHSNVLLVDAGDYYQSSRYWHAFKGEPDIDLMNQLRYDVAALGNHDFDGGLDLLATRIRQANFPILCTNVQPDPLDELAGMWSPWLIKQVDGVRVGFFSLLIDDLHLFTPEFAQTMTCSPIHAVAEKIVAQLRAQTDVLILLSHLGHEEDELLAEAVSGIDLIIGAHTHTPLHEIYWVNGTPLTRSIVGGQFIGCVEIEIDISAARDERSTIRDYELVALSNAFVEDEAVASEIVCWTSRLPAEQPLGYLRTFIDTTQLVKAGGESAAGNLYVDALLAGGVPGTQLAFAHMGTLRGDRAYGPGAFTNLDLSEYHPFPNRPTTRRLNGPQIKALLERGVASLPVAAAWFVAVAGLIVQVDLSRQPQIIDFASEQVLTHGQRVRNVLYQGEALDFNNSDLSFIAVMDEFMGKGGAGFFFLKESPVVHQSERSGADVVADYFAQHGSVGPSVEGRIQIVG